MVSTDHHTRLHALALPPHTSSMLVITATINKNKLNKLPKQLAHALMLAAQEYQPQHQLCVEAAIKIATEMVELELDGPSVHFTLEIHFDMDVIAGMAQQLKNIRVKELQVEQKQMKFLDSHDLN